MKHLHKKAKFLSLLRQESGAALLSVIIGIIVVASIGTAIISTTMSSTKLQLGSIDNINAYFLAESGMHYALTYLVAEMKEDDDPDDSGNSMDLLDDKTFTLPNNAGQFHLTLDHNSCPGSSCYYTLTSDGIPNAKTKRKITYIVKDD